MAAFFINQDFDKIFKFVPEYFRINIVATNCGSSSVVVSTVQVLLNRRVRETLGNIGQCLRWFLQLRIIQTTILPIRIHWLAIQRYPFLDTNFLLISCTATRT